MGNFSINTRARAWIATIQIANMEKAGIPQNVYENPEQLAEIFTSIWNDSGQGRTCGIAVCVSADGLYHAHMALYGNTTTLKKVSDTLYGSHVEPQLGGKKALTAYLRKEGVYEEKGEHVLCTKDIDAIQDVQGQRHDLDAVQDFLDSGMTPNEIFRLNIRYRKYSEMIKAAYLDKRLSEMPVIKEMHNEFHIGKSKTGKSYTYKLLCDKYGRDQIYLLNDLQNGGLDLYVPSGCPPILFVDDLKASHISYAYLLNMLDQYTDLQSHSRFHNTYNLWDRVIINSIYPLEDIYKFLVNEEQRGTDSFYQLLRRFETIVYHYVENGEYRTFSIPAEDYIDYDDLVQRATSDQNGFIAVSCSDEVPFND